MYSLLLALIYLSFISLGLPDALLGAAWPSMYPVLDAPVSYAGIVSMIIAAGTIISSLNANWAISRFGTGRVTAASVLMTAVSLFGFSVSGRFWMLCIWAVPYGLGAGAVDAALNNYVALHYSSRHMSWLHCCWGIGASAGPYIMSYCLAVKSSWRSGYLTVGIFQTVLAAVLIISLPVWGKQKNRGNADIEAAPKYLKVREALKIRGVRQAMLAFFAYCGLETTAGLWASSYLVLSKGIEAKAAAGWASLFYLGITVGRFLSGIVSDKLKNRNMIRIGLCLIAAGLLAVIMPVKNSRTALAGLVITGLGCAPVYPCIIHQTPENFGEENSQAIIGIQMASAYAGSTFMPPLFGLLAGSITIALYPAFLSLFLVLMIVMTEWLNRLVTVRC